LPNPVIEDVGYVHLIPAGQLLTTQSEKWFVEAVEAQDREPVVPSAQKPQFHRRRADAMRCGAKVRNWAHSTHCGTAGLLSRQIRSPDNFPADLAV
jgi:hypothetical protein